MNYFLIMIVPVSYDCVITSLNEVSAMREKARVCFCFDFLFVFLFEPQLRAGRSNPYISLVFLFHFLFFTTDNRMSMTYRVSCMVSLTGQNDRKYRWGQRQTHDYYTGMSCTVPLTGQNDCTETANSGGAKTTRYGICP